MARVKIPYYVIKGPYRIGYWQPKNTMRALGARPIVCGPDGPQAWAKAAQANREWKASQKQTRRAAPPAPPPSRYKAGTIAEAFAKFRATSIWQSKTPASRDDWLRGWRYIEPAFGDVKPASVTLDVIANFRDKIVKNKGEREAHRAIKIWRALWKVMAALRYCPRDADPSLAVRNVEPKRRSAFWEFGEVRQLCRRAWEEGYYGLAALIAVAWDTSMSPVDVRSLRPMDRQGRAFVLHRAKTGAPVVGTLTSRSERVLGGYLLKLGVEVAPNAPIFRTKGFTPGAAGGRPTPPVPYTKDSLGGDFRTIRTLVFGEAEGRTLADLRRSGVIEARRGGASNDQIGTKLGNAFASNSLLAGTYGPAEVEAVKLVDEARRKARRKGSG